MKEFRKLGLSEKTVKALEKKGFKTPTTIQAKAIPLLLEGKRDVVGQSQTGTGKTASFALPILEKIQEHSGHIQAIILAPTRELAVQVSDEINSLKGDRNIKVAPIYGGASASYQRKQLKAGVDIVVGTPGRVMDLQKRNSLKLDHIKYAVLDEADEMLNMGFVEDIESILKNTPRDKSMLLFSATMPKPILRIAQKYMREYDFIEVEKTQTTTTTVEQIYYNISAKDRLEGLKRVFDYYTDFYGIVFCNRKHLTDTLAHQLTDLGYNAASLHGDITQGQREKILRQFKNKRVKILVATDVAARGIDVNDLTHVINYSLPQTADSYVHRIGRTGRAGKKGISITFVIPSEKRQLKNIERVNKCEIKLQEIPSALSIISNKENHIKEVIQDILKGDTDLTKYRAIARELLSEHDPKDTVAAILKYSFKNELDSSTYGDLEKVKPEKSRFKQRSGRSRSRKFRSHKTKGKFNRRSKFKKRG